MTRIQTLSTADAARIALGAILLLAFARQGEAAPLEKADGFLHTATGIHFPIGFYRLPEDDRGLKELAASGVNLVRCRDRADLDRCKAAGIQGWIPLPVDAGPTESLKKRVLELRDHPALAVWEGPDEVVWNFTAYSGLAKSANITRDDWIQQRPNAVAYARKEAARIMPRMREAIRFVKENDPAHRPFWINEAGQSDVSYVRQYLDSIDVTGCDFYPVKADRRDLVSIGKMTDRWRMAGRGMPVWMVLQAFSWHKGRPERNPEPAYPTFEESRFMAWDAIVHGARGILYWGAEIVDDGDFLPSIHAVTAELAALEPFLVGWGPDDGDSAENPRPVTEPRWPSVRLVEANLEGKTKLGVRMTFRVTSENEWLIVLVNEDDIPHHGVEVRDLGSDPISLGIVEGREFFLLHGDETVKVEHGELMTRMRPHEVKLFATSRKWESPRTRGRDYRGD